MGQQKYKKQIIKLMQAPQGINLRSHHSLKSSTINDVSSGQHMNPLSSRLGVGKKISVNSKNEQYNNIQTSKTITNYESLNSLNQPRLPYQASGTISKNQLYITLGNRTKQSVNNYNTGYQTGPTEGQQRLEYIMNELQKQNKRLTILQLKTAESNNTNINTKLKQQLQMLQSKMYQISNQNNVDFKDISNQIELLRKQISVVVDWGKGRQEESEKQEQKQKQKEKEEFQRQVKQSLREINKQVNDKLGDVEAKMLEILGKESQRISGEFEKKLDEFQDKVSQYLDKRRYNDTLFFQTGSFVEKLQPLFRNPNIRLKILGKVSLFQKDSKKNPENEGEGEQEIEQWPIEEYCCTYMIDQEGYLLDQDGKYLINNKGQCVQLSEDQINTIMSVKMLETSNSISLFNN